MYGKLKDEEGWRMGRKIKELWVIVRLRVIFGGCN